MEITPLAYHQRTSYDRNKMSGHLLDWGNQPSVFKTYPGRKVLALPRDIHFPKTSFPDLLGKEEESKENKRIQSKRDLSRLLLLAYTLTAKARHPGGEFTYRSAASAGALYPTELYVALRGLEDLEDGLYYFSISHHGLVLLRHGNVSGAMKDMTKIAPGEPSPVVFFFTAIFFRSAWKYRERSYRYHLLDTGHVIENLFLASKALGLPLCLSFDFDDRGANQLLGLDDSREVCLALATVPGDGTVSETPSSGFPDLSREVTRASRVASKETDYPLIREMHWSGLEKTEKTVAWAMFDSIGLRPPHWKEIAVADTPTDTVDFTQAVFGRRSRRNFVKKTLPTNTLSNLLNALTRIDAPPSPYRETICAGFITQGCENLPDAFYLLDTSAKAFGEVSRDANVEAMARISLDQLWLANAGVHFLFMTNLEVLGQACGGRGYRYAMMTAGRMGERLYLTAESLGLGCCGIGAFYDGEAAQLLTLDKDSRLLYLVAVGQVKKKIS